MTNYALRFTERARRDIAQARAYLADIVGDTAADAWEADLIDGIASLATMPGARSIAPESELFPGLTIRQMLHRRTRSSAAFRVLFVVLEDQTDGPTVLIFHVRHAARQPISEEEARQLAADLS